MTKVIGKMSEMRQQDNENVNRYLSRCGMILADLKENVQVEEQHFNLMLSPGITAAWNALNADVRTEMALEFKRTSTKIVLIQVAGFQIVA